MTYEIHPRGNGIWDVRRGNMVLASYWSEFDAKNDVVQRESTDQFQERLASRS